MPELTGSRIPPQYEFPLSPLSDCFLCCEYLQWESMAPAQLSRHPMPSQPTSFSPYSLISPHNQKVSLLTLSSNRTCFPPPGFSQSSNPPYDFSACKLAVVFPHLFQTPKTLYGNHPSFSPTGYHLLFLPRIIKESFLFSSCLFFFFFSFRHDPLPQNVGRFPLFLTSRAHLTTFGPL